MNQGKHWRKTFEEIVETAADAAARWTPPRELPEDVAVEYDREAAEEPVVAEPARRRLRPGLWFVLASLLFVVLLLLFSTVRFVVERLQETPWIGLLFLALAAVVFASLILYVVAEWRSLRRYKHLQAVRRAVREAAEQAQPGEAIHALHDLLATYRQRPALTTGVERFEEMVSDAHAGEDVLQLFSREVLTPMDRQAQAVVRRASAQTAAGVALSPLALIDALFAVWRTLAMIRRIAAIYQARPGGLASLHLVKLVLGSLVYASTSEILTDLGPASLAPMVSARLAQGFGAGVLSARIGIRAMRLCRPVAFEEGEEPRLRDIVSGLKRQMERAS